MRSRIIVALGSCWFAAAQAFAATAPSQFIGRHFAGVGAGAGDVAYLQSLDTSARMLRPDPQYENLSMLYEPKWDGLVEGPTWDAWWVQNSYGPTYAALPLVGEPMISFIQHAQDLWFAKQGDAKRAGKNGFVAPDGCLCDCANLDTVYYRQGDGQPAIHDWFMEATAAAVVLQSELLLVTHDAAAANHYLPHLERAANFIETRRDPKTGLYLGGVACNLLAPSFGGYLKPDGSRGLAYHAGLQVTYIAALDRLIEVEKLAGRHEVAAAYTRRRDLAKSALTKFIHDGYFINSIDPDGTKHGVFGAKTHGYFESSVNQDAICFRVADDVLAKSIYAKIASIPQLRPHDFLIPNYPCYDDMYEKPQGLWTYGTWVNGGDWSTCEARMIIGYYRLGHFADAARSMKQLMKFANAFRMDNPLTDFGNAVYQAQLPINITYDAFGVPAAMIRGLFEYIYKSDCVVLIPHIPPGITQLEQRDPIHFGRKKIYLTTAGKGVITDVTVNGRPWDAFTPTDVTLAYDRLPDKARVTISLGFAAHAHLPQAAPVKASDAGLTPELIERAAQLRAFDKKLHDANLDDSYEAADAKMTRDAIDAIAQRKQSLDEKKFAPLPPVSEKAAEQLYLDAASKLWNGLAKVIAADTKSSDPAKRAIAAMWIAK